MAERATNQTTYCGGQDPTHGGEEGQGGQAQDGEVRAVTPADPKAGLEQRVDQHADRGDVGQGAEGRPPSSRSR